MLRKKSELDAVYQPQEYGKSAKPIKPTAGEFIPDQGRFLTRTQCSGRDRLSTETLKLVFLFRCNKNKNFTYGFYIS